MPWNLCYLAGLISLMAGSKECFRDFIFISVNINKCFQRSMQSPNLSFSRWTPMTFLQKRSAHQLNLAHSGHWTWWWFNGREQEKCAIRSLKITLGKLKFISFLAAQCLALHPWALQAIIIISDLFGHSCWELLWFCQTKTSWSEFFCASFLPHLILFGDLGNQYSDGFSRIWTDFQLFQR